MTLQVALVGTDGTVIASDKKVRKVGGGPFTTYLASKFIFSESRRTVACWAGTEFSEIAKLLLQEERCDDRSLQKIMTDALENGRIRMDGIARTGEVILLSVENPRHIRHFKSGLSDPIFPEDKVFSGDSSNPAVSLAELFYKSGLSSEELTRLAAHTVCTASRYNPAGVGGLEIVICRSKGFKVLESKMIYELIEWSRKLDSDFCSQVLCESR